jgi:hypothetical protein
MMRTILFTFLISVSVNIPVSTAQICSDDVTSTLEKLYLRLLINIDDADRIRINDSVRMIIDSYIESDSVFNHRFNNLRYLGQITAPDSLLKIITWNLILQNGTNKYFSYFVRKSASSNENHIYRLTGNYSETPIRTDTFYFESDWYGSLYYDVRPLVTDDDTCYILLGIDFGNSFITRKIIEVISFAPDGRLVFGKDWFVAGDETKYREVLEYASTGVTILRFLSDESIVFDHLVPFSPEFEGDRRYYGPDYSYDAYNYHNGKWELTLNVDVRNKE